MFLIGLMTKTACKELSRFSSLRCDRQQYPKLSKIKDALKIAALLCSSFPCADPLFSLQGPSRECLRKGLPGMESKLSCLGGVGKETALTKNSTGSGHPSHDTKHCSATPVCCVNHSPPWTSGISEEQTPLSSTPTELLYFFKGMQPETDQGRFDGEGVLWKGARPNWKYLFDSLIYLFDI